jgi:hypothetical protein
MCEALPAPDVPTFTACFFDSAISSCKGLRRHRFVHHQTMRREVGEPYRDEVLQRIVVELRLHERIDCERPIRAGEQRVAIRCGARRHFGTQAAACAGAVFGHERLAERLAHALTAQPRDEVRIAAGRERHDQPHRLVRIGGGRMARQRAHKRRGRDRGEQCAA